MNFVCAARSRGFDISNIIVFTTDKETTELAESLGLATYYDHRVRVLCYRLVPQHFVGREFSVLSHLVDTYWFRTLATFRRKQQSATGIPDLLP